jgi:NAD(P)-dependent dehydrogenase (short-subunit alcohol dehydrogenase family)
MCQKAVLITGTSSGIGLETALFLAERGFHVYASMRDLSRRGVLEDEAKRRGLTLSVLQLDVNDTASIHRSVDQVVRECGEIYGLVSNAGIVIEGYFEDISDTELRQVYETNLFGTMAVTRAVLPYMRDAGCGRIVFMSSAGARIAAPGSSPYCSSKFALEGFAESLAQEVLPLGLRIVLVEPGFVNTELFGNNHHTAVRSLDPNGPYYAWFQQLEKMAHSEALKSPTSVVDVAQVVHRALTAKRPNLRYVVRFRSKALIALRCYLPGELFEKLWFYNMIRRTTRSKPFEGGA